MAEAMAEVLDQAGETAEPDEQNSPSSSGDGGVVAPGGLASGAQKSGSSKVSVGGDADGVGGIGGADGALGNGSGDNASGLAAPGGEAAVGAENPPGSDTPSAEAPSKISDATAPKPPLADQTKNTTDVTTAEPVVPFDAGEHPPVTLNERYLIAPAVALSDFNSPTALAYGVEDRREPGRKLFALVCTPGLVSSTETMKKLRNSNVNGIVPVVEYGPVFWSPLNQICMTVIFERPLGGRFIHGFKKGHIQVNEYEIMRRVVEPLLPGLRKLAEIGIAHRAVRIDNLYYMDEEKHELVLGECVTVPPGHDQPIIYETIERAMAMPSGRGSGLSLDDLYALGIMAVLLLLGKNPKAKKSDEAILAGKAESGTYQYLCAKERIPLQLIELIRGLLADDIDERWTISNLEKWVDGQQLSPKQRKAKAKAASKFSFAGREYATPRAIAHAFCKNVTDAAKSIKSGKLDVWLRKSLSNPGMAELVSSVVTVCKVHEGNAEGSDDILISKVCIYLDPIGPIRYKGFFFMADGFGPALAIEYLRKGNFQIPAEILARDLVAFWVAAQEESNSETMALNKMFATLRSFTKINELGYGMERCLYELNQFLPCQGEYLHFEYVSEIEDLLPALDSIADKVDHHSRPMDKHIAAFVTTHFKYDIQPHLKALNDPKEEISLIGLLSLYALIQWRLKIENLFGLSSWMGGLLQPAIGTYHSRTTQRSIEQEIPALVRQGSLPDIFDLIDNSVRRTNDKMAFEQAQIEFSMAESQIMDIAGENIDQEQVALEAGERATAMMSVVVSMIAITVIIFLMVM